VQNRGIFYGSNCKGIAIFPILKYFYYFRRQTNSLTTAIFIATFKLYTAKGSPTQGATYEFADIAVQNGKTYYYKLEDIDLSGKSTMHGPVSAMPRLIFGFRD
jgi:hypothetical protein